MTRFSPTVDSLTGPAVACQACQHSGDKARLKFHRGNPTPQLAIVKWLNKRPAAGNLGSTAHSNRSSSALSTLVATAPTFLPNASMHKAPTKGLLNSYRHCNQPLQKSPGSKICSFQEVFVGDSCQQPKVVLHRSELCLCYLRALANPQASFIELTLWHLGGTLSPQVEAVYIIFCFNSECNTVKFSHYLSMLWHVLI